MNSIQKAYLGLALIALSSTGGLQAADPLSSPKVAMVNFKSCVENSKAGKQEQANFDKMKKQMEDVLAEKEKSLKELSTKINDEDYLDSLSKEAQAELKHKYRVSNQEIAQQQQQFFQMLQQANYKILQKMTEEVSEAAKIVAKNKNLDLVLNEEGVFYYNSALDISQDIIKAMDARTGSKEDKKQP